MPVTRKSNVESNATPAQTTSAIAGRLGQAPRSSQISTTSAATDQAMMPSLSARSVENPSRMEKNTALNRPEEERGDLPSVALSTGPQFLRSRVRVVDERFGRTGPSSQPGRIGERQRENQARRASHRL